MSWWAIPNPFYERVGEIWKDGSARVNAAEDYSSNLLLNRLGLKIEEELHGEALNEWWEGMKRLPTSLLMDFRLFEVTKEIVPTAVGLASSVHEDVLKAAAASFSPKAEEHDLVAELEGKAIPDYANLSWSEIFRLKESGYLSDFRKMTANLTISPVNISPELLGSLWDLVGEVKPNMKRTYVTSIAGNIPLPFPNPIGVLDDIRSMLKDDQLTERYGWLFFIQETRRKVLSKQH
ncbi:MAG TPA: hypothetical protein VND41_00590 [Nitrososphaerales archaeon]|nr:hypothetical protein [Nitrososphaerales archaeon]